MRRIWLIVKREYMTRVRTKGFVFGTVAVPLFGIGVVVFSLIMATMQIDHTMRIAVVDETGRMYAALNRNLTVKPSTGQPMFEIVETVVRPPSKAGARLKLIDSVNRGQLEGFVIVPEEVTSGRSVEFHSKNTGDFTVMGLIGRAVNDAMIEQRLGDRGIRIENIADLVRQTDLKLVKVTRHGEITETGQTFITALVAAMLLYTTLIMYGVITMRSVLEEKTTRIVEVLVSSVRPLQLLAGKVLGVAAVAFTQYLIWVVTAALLGAYSSAMAGGFMRGFHVPMSLLAYLVVYFLLGYMLYASLYASIGAMASNEQDAQQLQWPATLPLLFSFLMFNYVLRDPSSVVSVVLSEIPFFAPVLMLLRIATLTPPLWQIVLSMALMVLTATGVVYLSGRIYRVGILMYGKRPSVAELLRWLRYT